MAKQQRLELTWFNKDKALIPTEAGKYGYTWVDPRDPRYCETRPLVFDEYVSGKRSPKVDGITYSERADLPPTNDNLLILGESGDVLEALTRIPELADKYVGKVKCIYIDPPFNTGDAFTHYEDNLEHSVWLTMMRDRLRHMKRLLSPEGSIWVHLDDNENHRMRVLLDEVFGPQKSVCTIVWEKNPTRENRTDISRSQDYIHVYAATGRETFKRHRNLLPQSRKQLELYENPDNDKRGVWSSLPMHARAEKGRRAEQFYTVTTPSGRLVDPPQGRCWIYTRERYEELLADDRITFGASGENVPRVKKFLNEVQQGLMPRTWWTSNEVGSNGDAKDEILQVLKAGPFSTPKPERLLERIIHIATDPGDIVLDVFAGSGTTAAVAQKMGRRWVSCELSEQNFARFTRPRLEKVIRDDDFGGVTTDKGTRVPADGVELPEGMSADDAQKLTSLLNKALGEHRDLKQSRQVKQIKQMVKTRKTPDTVNWRGGGGFQVAHLAPACFDYDPDLGMVMLTEAAADPDRLVASVAAQLRFRLTPDQYFHGIQGRARLYVTHTPATPALAAELASHLGDGESLILASPTVVDGAGEALRGAARGSRVVHIPDDLFESFGEEARK